jgi:hypothetical protein
MRNDEEVTSDHVGWLSGDASCAKQIASLGLESFQVVS